MPFTNELSLLQTCKNDINNKNRGESIAKKKFGSLRIFFHFRKRLSRKMFLKLKLKNIQ